MLSDFHVHSKFSNDSDEDLENIISKAISLNMKDICITDHQDWFWPVPGESFDIDTDSYFNELNILKDKYSSKINLHIGVELGITCDNYKKNADFLQSYPFEYVIGSCHIVDNMDPYYSEFWENRNEADAFRTYFSTLLDALKLFNSFNTLGHLDYIVRYAPNKDKNYNCSDYFNIVEQIFKEIIHKNIALEINTGALAKGMDFVNPHFDMLSFYKDLGGKLVAVGSDAHVADNIGYGFDKAAQLIEHFNFKNINE